LKFPHSKFAHPVMKVDRQTSVDQIILLSLYMQFSAEHRGRSGANTERI